MADPDSPDPDPPAVESEPPRRSWGPRASFARLTALGGVSPQLDLRIVVRTLLHAAVVGLSAGLIGAAFFAGLAVRDLAVNTFALPIVGKRLITRAVRDELTLPDNEQGESMQELRLPA